MRVKAASSYAIRCCEISTGSVLLPLIPESDEFIEKRLAIAARPAGRGTVADQVMLFVSAFEQSAIRLKYPIHRRDERIAGVPAADAYSAAARA